jgi:hypothetical protein
MKDMHSLRLCLECSWENPAQVDTEEPIALNNKSSILAEVMEARVWSGFSSIRPA